MPPTPADLAALPLRALSAPNAVIGVIREVLDEVRILNGNMRDVTAELKQVQREGGPLDRLVDVSQTLDRLAGLDESLERIATVGKSLEKIADVGDSLDKIASAAEHLERIADVGESLDKIAEAAESLEKIADVGDSLNKIAAVAEHLPAIAVAAGNLETLQPTLDKLAEQVDLLGDALEPIGNLAGRMPGARAARR